jgi:hypothetical protein
MGLWPIIYSTVFFFGANQALWTLTGNVSRTQD